MANLCPTCKNVLDEKDYCSVCRKTVYTYERIRRASKQFYNEGLQKAKARDLSGAAEILGRSIKYDKNNIDARNLLGLVYFELGEPVLAIRQWVISQNMRPKDNVATRYLKKVQDNQVNLDKLNTAIKKYNQSLVYVNQNSSDLAMIQLKKIITINPKFLKAYNLLALIYIQEEELDKAKQVLLKVLSIDKNNYIARKYYDSLLETEDEGELIPPEEEAKREKTRVRRQIVINQSVQQFLGVVFGLVVGVALFYFLILPNQLNGKNERIDEAENNVITLNNENEELAAEKAENEATIRQLESELEQAMNESTSLANLRSQGEHLMTSTSNYLDGELEKAAANLYAFDLGESTDGLLNTLYEQLAEVIYPEASRQAYLSGYSYYNSGAYEEAITDLTAASHYVTDEYYADDVFYFLARSYQRSEQTQEAIETFKQLLTRFPNSDRYSDGRIYMESLGGSLE